MKLQKNLLCVIFSLLILSVSAIVPVIAADTEDDKTVTVEGYYNYDFAVSVFNLLNQEREKNGLNPLVLDENITAKSMLRAAECSVYFDHTRPNGKSFYTVFDKEDLDNYSGENIAWGQITPEEVMEDWMNSEGYRKNILNPYFTNVGIGVCESKKSNIYWVQDFMEKDNPGEAEYIPSGKEYVSVEIDLKREEAVSENPLPKAVSFNEENVFNGDADMTVIVFGRPTCGNTMSTLNSLSESDLLKNDKVKFYFADIDNNRPDTINIFAENMNIPEIVFCYDTTNSASNMMWENITSSSVQLPVIVYFDKNKNAVACDTGFKTAKQISDTLENAYKSNEPDNPGVERIAGDVNDDCKVDMKDVTRLQKYINKWDVTIKEDNSDVNGDEKITMKDIVLLQKYINKWDVVLK